ncbi:hypothetical protein AYK26_01450 [Euryarchaeota archaeon SM23-78]|nr:MAG: hypothetical protein AYK26_01450 [Euryarchaeota archaeon SM23-78]MBW3000467.1 DUF1461 domain-containing protein [Candidatus Woesearchaeota archaeon]
MKEQNILVILSCILIVFILFSASFFLVLIDRSFYDKSFKKYGVYDEIGALGVRNTVDYLINYLTSGNTEINEIEELSIFTPDEQLHLQDVRNIIIWIKALSIGAAVLLFAFIMRLSVLKDYKLNIKRMLIYGGISTLTVLIIIFLLSLNFSPFFMVFHKIFFPQGNYIFPAHYLLIKLFPQELFKDFARKMFFHTLLMSLILLFIGLGSSSALAIRNSRRN